MESSPEYQDDAAVVLTELKLKINADLHRAFQRCAWIIVHETGRSQVDVMHEMVEDFLRKHGC
jgi:hypothetical protein